MIKMEFERYAAYKDSGVEWIGEVPAHWEVRRVKEVGDINKSTLSEKTPASYEFDYVDIGSVTYGVKGYTKERMAFDVAPSRAKRIVQKGDTIISTVRTYLKAIATIDEEVSDLIVSTGFAVISPRKEIVDKFCSYLLTSNCIVDEICALSTGVSYPATNATVIGDLFFLIPPLPEQQAIAAYLDTKTSQIDRKIDLLTQKTTSYAKLKQSLINETVTRGLDKSVPMKDSGVEWIGEIPAHWKIVRLKDISVIRKGDVFDFDAEEGNIPYLNGGMTPSGYSNKSNMPSGLIAVSEGGASSGYIQFMDIPFWCGIHCYAILQKTKSKKYLFYCLKGFERVLSSLKTGSAIPNLKKTEISNFIIPITTDYEEQMAITSYLDKKFIQIDKIIEIINTQVEKLKELRKTLINDVVTGKIKVVKEDE